MNDQLQSFPIHLLRVNNAQICNLTDSSFTLILSLEEICLNDTNPNGDWAESKKTFLLEFESITVRDISEKRGGFGLHDLSGQEFHLPINPHPGYVESAIYVSCAHNPVGLLGIRFHEVVGNSITLVASLRFNMEFESSGYRDFTIELPCNATFE